MPSSRFNGASNHPGIAEVAWAKVAEKLGVHINAGAGAYRRTRPSGINLEKCYSNGS